MTTPDAGTRIDNRYIVEEALGSGGESDVYRALDEASESIVALRIMKPDASELALARWERARLLWCDSPPGVVQLLGHGRWGGRPYLVLEHIAGSCFPGVGSATTWAALEPLARSLLRVVADLHALDILHRDINPSNFLLREDGTVIMLDLGVCTREGQNLLTMQGKLVGTIPYMAPELFEDAEASVKTELYAVGLMLWEALMGAHPHAIDHGSFFKERLDTPVPPVACADVPPRVVELIERLTHRDPDKRPHSAEEALQELAELSWDVGDLSLTETCTAADIRGLLQGHERVWHRPSTLTAHLHRNCAGRTELLVDDLRHLCARGVLRWTGSAFQIETGPPYEHPPPPTQLATDLSKTEASVLQAAVVAWPHADEETLRRLTTSSVSDVLQTLTDAGHLLPLKDATYRPLRTASRDGSPMRQRLSQLSPGHPALLRHLRFLLPEARLRDAEIRAHRHLDDGRANRALSLLMRVARMGGLPVGQTPLASLWVRAAIGAKDPRAYALAHRELDAAPEVHKVLLAQAAATHADPESAEHATATLEGLGPLADPGLESTRHVLLVTAGSRIDIGRRLDAAEAWLRWARSTGDGQEIARASVAVASALVQDNRPSRALAVLEAVGHCEGREATIVHLTRASRSLELHRLPEVVAQARLALEHNTHRIPEWSAMAETLIRMAMHRQRQGDHVDTDLVEAMRALPVPARAYGLLTEAAIARRLGDLRLAGQLALEVESTPGATPAARRLGIALAAMCNAPIPHDVLREAISLTCMSDPPGVALQVLAMGSVRMRMRRTRTQFDQCLAELGDVNDDDIREVLSIREAKELLDDEH